MFDSSPKYPTMGALFDAEDQSVTPLDDFDTNLWLLLVRKIESLQDVANLPHQVGLYFSTRLVQWEVGNGGFSEAVFNVPEWFELASSGYKELGYNAFAALIDQASLLIRDPDDPSVEADLAAIDDVLSDLPYEEWEIDDSRVDYVKRNREAFTQLDRLWSASE